jgi:hypothetical protein
MTAWWDNSADNPSNPDPTKNITWGRPTTSEMMFAWMRYTDPEVKEDNARENDVTDKTKKEASSTD